VSKATTSASLSDLPRDELLRYGRDLALPLKNDTPQGELLRLIRARQELLLEIEREALLDLVVWARRPVRASASKEELVHELADLYPGDLTGLSRRGLEALARLRGLGLQPGEADRHLAERIRTSISVWERMRRRRRKLVGHLIGRAVRRGGRPKDQEYHFLPETGDTGTLGESGPKAGLVGGLARKIKGEIQGAADEYIDAKLDEVERRIDAKLDEIDARLAEWRDREVRNRLRIIKITLLTTIVVALVSLGYSYLKAQAIHSGPEEPAPRQVPSLEQPEAGPAPPAATE